MREEHDWKKRNFETIPGGSIFKFQKRKITILTWSLGELTPVSQESTSHGPLPDRSAVRSLFEGKAAKRKSCSQEAVASTREGA